MLAANVTSYDKHSLTVEFQGNTQNAQYAGALFRFNTNIYYRTGVSSLRQLNDWKKLSEGSDAVIMSSSFTKPPSLRKHSYPLIFQEKGTTTFSVHGPDDAHFSVQFKQDQCVKAFKDIYAKLSEILKDTPTPAQLKNDPYLLLDQILSWDSPMNDDVDRLLNSAFLRQIWNEMEEHSHV